MEKIDYQKEAKEVRKEVLTLIHRGQTSHIASCYSAVDIMVVLYENLQKDDLVIWSAGWKAALHYILEIRRGNLDRETVFNTFPNAPYLGLLERSCPTVITAGGSVGHGLPVAVGLALARKRAGELGNIYCLMSDGELNEGSTWEAVMLASQHKLNNLIAIIDVNGWQAMGKTSDVIQTEPIEDKWMSFNWKVQRINGHDHAQILEALTTDFTEDVQFQLGVAGSPFTQPVIDDSYKDKPMVIIADTVKGKGVSFMENHLLYHYAHVDDEVYTKGMAELNGQSVDIISQASHEV